MFCPCVNSVEQPVDEGSGLGRLLCFLETRGNW